MILTHKDLKAEIEISEEQINIWVIESKQLLGSFIKELIGQSRGDDGGFVLYEGKEILRLKDHIDIISDYFNISFNSKKIQSRILKVLTKYAEDDLFQSTIDLKGRLQQYFENLLDTADLDIEYEDTMDIADVLKLYNISINESYGSILEAIINYLKICTRIFEKQCFIFVNLSFYMNREDLMEVYKFVQYEKICVLFIENTMKEDYKDKNCLILDQDYCII